MSPSSRAVTRKGPSRKPTRARDAASLILLNSAVGEPEVLVGRRPSGSRFMPNLYVFPGGAVEASDSRALPASTLNPGIAAELAVAGRSGRARSLAMAAVRETFEESGLLLGAPGDVGASRSRSWSAIRALGLAPDLAQLAYVGRAITPMPYAIRFHARFFVADARHLCGNLAGHTELEDLHWRSVSEACHLPMADVQSFMLAHAVRVMKSGDHTGGAKPLFTQRAGRRYVRYDKARR